MAKVAKAKKSVPEKSVEASLWESANKLRGSVEPAEYKHVVLSLIFLKFASDKFEEQREKLIAAGIETVDQLLAKGKTPKGRKELEEATGINGKLILTWVNHADLFRIKGIGPQFSELLEASGVDTVKELQHRVAANLVAKMTEVNAEKNLTRVVPTEVMVQKMIDQAKVLPPMVEY